MFVVVAARRALKESGSAYGGGAHPELAMDGQFRIQRKSIRGEHRMVALPVRGRAAVR
jgi:hypothetical protein